MFSRPNKLALWDVAQGLQMPGSDQPSDVGGNGPLAAIRSINALATPDSSALLDVPLRAAAQNVVPFSATAVESVERLRTWASGRCLDADRGGIYSRSPSSSTAKPRRKVRRDPLNN